MLASSEVVLSVVGVVLPVLPLFSWMRMVMMSPTARAFLSENIGRELSIRVRTIGLPERIGGQVGELRGEDQEGQPGGVKE